MRSIIVLGGLAAVLLCGCGGDASPKPPEEATQPVQLRADVQSANLQFAMRMLNQLDSESGANLCFSPLSLSIALSMTLNGAEGETYDALAQTLGYEKIPLSALNPQMRVLNQLLKPSDPDVVIHTANSLWIQQGFEIKPEFLRTLLTFYETRTEPVDFSGNPEAAAEQINRWVKEQTQGLIEKLFATSDFNAQTRLALVNTLYFEGKWQFPFNKDATQEAPFYLENGKTKSVPMMVLSEKLPYYKGEGFAAVALPYGKGDYQFYLLAPDKGRSVAELRKQFTPENWAQWTAGFRTMDGVVRLPRFKVESTHDLKPPLSALGMKIAFDPDRADFRRIAEVAPERLYLQKAIQKAVIEVDESGTKAAAATGITVGVTSAPMERFELVADRPFMFVIAHQPTGTVLFMGIVREP
ncbi:MAG: serine proteinase inhibitor [Fimbriimonadales bacterium]|nr:MAG: serine proteinase inhibitor [Fimbriimonadales bacterium]